MNAKERDRLNEIATLKRRLETLAKLTGFWCKKCEDVIEPTKCVSCKEIICERCSILEELYGDVVYICSEGCRSVWFEENHIFQKIYEILRNLSQIEGRMVL